MFVGLEERIKGRHLSEAAAGGYDRDPAACMGRRCLMQQGNSTAPAPSSDSSILDAVIQMTVGLLLDLITAVGDKPWHELLLKTSMSTLDSV